MVEIACVTVKRHPEESARNGVFWERDHQHFLANPGEWGEMDGEVFIADDLEHLVADTSAVRQAIKINRLVEVEKSTVLWIDSEVKATDAARALAQENDLDLALIAPTGKDGQVTLNDVKAAIRAAQTSE